MSYLTRIKRSGEDFALGFSNDLMFPCDTNNGLSGSDIERVLSDGGINDPSPTATKKHCLFEALNQKQSGDNRANYVFLFIKEVMSPVRYRNDTEAYLRIAIQINEVLLFAGVMIGEDGNLIQARAATTISEAQERAGRLRRKLPKEMFIRMCSDCAKGTFFEKIFSCSF